MSFGIIQELHFQNLKQISRLLNLFSDDNSQIDLFDLYALVFRALNIQPGFPTFKSKIILGVLVHN